MSLPSNRELRPLAPFRTITDKELTGTQPELVFDVVAGQEFLIDGKEFDHTRLDRTMKLNGVEGVDLIIEERQPSLSHSRQSFPGDQNQWQTSRSSLARHHPCQKRSSCHGDDADAVRGLYRPKYVLHCHNLVHEDRGMMQMVENFVLVNEPFMCSEFLEKGVGCWG